MRQQRYRPKGRNLFGGDRTGRLSSRPVSSSADVKDGVSVRFCESFDGDEIRFFRLLHAQSALHGTTTRVSTYASRAFRLLPVDLMKHGLEGLFQHLILGALIKLADEVSAGLQGLEAELQSCHAKVLGQRGKKTTYFKSSTRHSPCFQRGRGNCYRSCSSS